MCDGKGTVVTGVMNGTSGRGRGTPPARETATPRPLGARRCHFGYESAPPGYAYSPGRSRAGSTLTRSPERWARTPASQTTAAI